MGSKSNAGVPNIPSTVDVLEENITKNPELCITVSQRCPQKNRRANLLPLRAGTEAAPARHILELSAIGPRLNESGEMRNSLPPTSIEMGVLKLQGTEIASPMYVPSHRRHQTGNTHWCIGQDHTVVLIWHPVFGQKTSRCQPGHQGSGWYLCQRPLWCFPTQYFRPHGYY